MAALRKRSRGCGRMFLAAGSGEAAPGCCSRDMGWARSGGHPLEEGPLGRDSLGMLGWTSQSGSPQRCGVTERGAWNVSKVYGSWLDPVLALLRLGGSSTHIPAATMARESPQLLHPWLRLFHFFISPILTLVFPSKLQCWRGTPAHSQGISDSPDLPYRVFLLSPHLPAFACSFQGLSRFLSVCEISASLFRAGSVSRGG